MTNLPPETEIKYLKIVEEFLVQEWESTQSPDTKDEIEQIASEIRRLCA